MEIGKPVSTRHVCHAQRKTLKKFELKKKRKKTTDVDKNKELSQALRIKGLPTLMIYKKGEMVWRQSGEQDANTLIGILNEYL